MTNLELKALLSISKIDLKKDLKQILNEILTIVGGEMGAHSGSIMLINEETGELEMVATFGLPDDYIERVYSKGVPIITSPSGVALKTGRYYPVPNIFEEPRTKPWMDLSRELGFSSQLFMPIKQRGEVIGLLNIYMANTHEFTESEIAFVTIAASQAAAVIENARLYARILNKNVELEREIAERKRAEEALCESEEFSSSLLGNSPNPILVVNPDTSVRYVNPALEELTGFSSAELIGRKAPYPWWTEEMLENSSRVLNEAMRKGAIRHEVLFQKKSGERFWVEITSAPVKKDRGLKYYLSDWVDITDRKRAEEALRESEEKYRTLFETAKDAIFLADETGKFVDVNQAASESLGYRKEELLGLSNREIDADSRGYEEFKKVRDGLVKETTFEVNQRRKDGTLLPVEINGSRFTSGGKRIALAIARDITERKQGEEALRKSEKKFRRLTETVPAAIFIYKGSKICYANPAAEAITGYTQEELLAMNFWDFVHPDFRDLVKKRGFARLRGEAVSSRYELKIVTKSGEERWLDFAASIIEFEGELAVLGVTYDITERKRMEEALSEREEQYRSIFESASEAFLICNPEGEVVDANPAACKMYGYPYEEFIGLSGKDVVHPDYYHIFEDFKKQVNSGRQFHAESVDLRKDGRTINTEVHGTSFNYKGKQHLLALVRDITERKRAEKEIKKLSSAVEQSIDGIAVGDLELNLTYVNNAFARMHGYSPEEMVGMNVVNLHTEEQIDENERCINQIKTQGSWMGEIRHIRKDGAHFPTYMYVTLLKGDDGKPTGILTVVRDITKHKQTEEALFEKGLELKHQITERKQVEAALERTERECREIAEFLPELISLLPILWRSELS